MIASRARRSAMALVAALALSQPAAGADAPIAPGRDRPIQDNSFLVEEAYNQEAGVVQHISTFALFRENRDWATLFTQEWPLGGQAHQIGFSLLVEDPGKEVPGESGIGDLALNYRYQLLGNGEARVALAPRVSLILPTGDETEGRGSGAAGVQINIPLSLEISRRFVTHANAGLTHLPSADNGAGDEADTTGYHLGQSLIWLARPAFNLLAEAVFASDEEVIGPGETSRGSRFFLSPGARWAVDLKSGLQIVPGIAVPIGLGASRGENAVFLYLSFEHPYRGQAAPRD